MASLADALAVDRGVADKLGGGLVVELAVGVFNALAHAQTFGMAFFGIRTQSPARLAGALIADAVLKDSSKLMLKIRIAVMVAFWYRRRHPTLGHLLFRPELSSNDAPVMTSVEYVQVQLCWRLLEALFPAILPILSQWLRSFRLRTIEHARKGCCIGCGERDVYWQQEGRLCYYCLHRKFAGRAP